MRISSDGGLPTAEGLSSSDFNSTLAGPLPRLELVNSVDISHDSSRLVIDGMTAASVGIWALDNVIGSSGR